MFSSNLGLISGSLQSDQEGSHVCHFQHQKYSNDPHVNSSLLATMRILLSPYTILKHNGLDYLSCVVRKFAFCICENKGADKPLCFCHIVQSFHFLNPKFQASSQLLWLYSPICVGPGCKPQQHVFSWQS